MSDGVDPRLLKVFEEAAAIFRNRFPNAPVPRITSGLRSIAEQTRLYMEWLRGERPGPVARPGTSKHERGAAVDFGLFDGNGRYVWQPSLMREFARIVQGLEPGIVWGGDWRGDSYDPVHLQAPSSWGSSPPAQSAEQAPPTEAPAPRRERSSMEVMRVQKFIGYGIATVLIVVAVTAFNKR